MLDKNSKKQYFIIHVLLFSTIYILLYYITRAVKLQDIVFKMQLEVETILIMYIKIEIVQLFYNYMDVCVVEFYIPTPSSKYDSFLYTRNNNIICK